MNIKGNMNLTEDELKVLKDSRDFYNYLINHMTNHMKKYIRNRNVTLKEIEHIIRTAFDEYGLYINYKQFMINTIIFHASEIFEDMKYLSKLLHDEHNNYTIIIDRTDENHVRASIETRSCELWGPGSKSIIGAIKNLEKYIAEMHPDIY